MARHVYIRGLSRPTTDIAVAREFAAWTGLLGLAVQEWPDPPHATVELPGAYADPWGKLRGEHPERWVEFHAEDGAMRVTTRLQDEFTNTLAVGFARAFARVHGREFDDGPR